MPNMVQTLENNPAFIHGGPFANIAHGCNSVLATQTALKLADYVVTEAGFGADLGAEKFFDIKCRKAGLKPNGGRHRRHRPRAQDARRRRQGRTEHENVAAVAKGCDNLGRHISNISKFGVPAVVAINKFVTDTEAEVAAVQEAAESCGTKAFLCTHWGEGGKGTEELARHVVEVCDSGKAEFKPLYPNDMPLLEKVRTIAKELYGAADVAADASVKNQLKDFEAAGYGHLPICMAKTQYSFTTDPNVRGAPPVTLCRSAK